MRFRNRPGRDEYLLAFFLGCGMIVMGLSSTDKGWAVIGAIIVLGTVIFAALDIYGALRGPRESESSKPLPTPLVAALGAVAVPGLGVYWYLTGDAIALLFAVVLGVLLVLLLLLRNAGDINIAKFSVGDAIPANLDEQNSPSGTSPQNPGAVTHKLELTMKPGEPPTLRSDDGSPVPLDIAIDSSDSPISGKEGSVLKGIVEAMRGNADGAIESFRRYGGTGTELPAVAAAETVALLTAHRYEEAVAAADRAIAAQPSSGVDRMLRGQALLALGAAEEALADFQAARRDGSAQGVETSIGAALFELGRTDEAITALEKGRGDAAASSATFFYLGEAYRAHGRDAEANDAYEEAAAKAIVEMQYGTAWHRDVLPIAGTTGFDAQAWCPDCSFYKLRRTPKKRSPEDYRY